MYDFFLQNAVVFVLAIALVIWGGVTWYLSRLETRISALEKTIQNNQP